MEELLPNSNETLAPPSSDYIPLQSRRKRESVKMIVVGSPSAVNSVLNICHCDMPAVRGSDARAIPVSGG